MGALCGEGIILILDSWFLYCIIILKMLPLEETRFFKKESSRDLSVLFL